MTQRSKGFSAITIIAIVAIVILAGLVAWRIYAPHKKQPQQSTVGKESSQPELTDKPNLDYLLINEWGVRFKLNQGLSDIKYFKPIDIGGDAFSFTTDTLEKTSVNCSSSEGKIVLGLLTRSVTPEPAAGQVLAEINGYTYQYRAPQATCGGDSAIENQATLDLSQSLKSIERIE